MRSAILLILCATALTWVESVAHPLNWTRLTLSPPDSDGRFEARLEIDLAPYVGTYEAYLDAAGSPHGGFILTEAAEQAWSDLSFHQDGQGVSWILEELIPPLPDEKDFFSPLPAPMTFVRWSGRGIPGSNPVVTLKEKAGMELPIVLRYLDTPGSLPVFLSAGQSTSRYAADNAPEASAKAGQTAAVSRPAPLGSLREYVSQGFVHILPRGLDHILFILALVLAGGSWRSLLLQVTAFTLAHTLTLALVTLDLVPAPPRLVEPLIALSIAWLAWENVRRTRHHSLRIGLVFIFGLLHGMGFATVLAEIGLPNERLIGALFAFNVGVELGQLTILAAAALALAWWRHSPRFRPWAVLPASLAIGTTASWWAIERAFLG